jgi:hypothetical protein
MFDRAAMPHQFLSESTSGSTHHDSIFSPPEPAETRLTQMSNDPPYQWLTPAVPSHRNSSNGRVVHLTAGETELSPPFQVCLPVVSLLVFACAIHNPDLLLAGIISDFLLPDDRFTVSEAATRVCQSSRGTIGL